MADLTEGNDVLVELIEGDVVINALGGGDVVHIINDDLRNPENGAGQVTLDGGSGSDELSVDDGLDALLYGRDGNDKLSFLAQSGEAYGGAGDDMITAYGF
jgi:Ca2+-binding RTX toxin-like protein